MRADRQTAGAVWEAIALAVLQAKGLMLVARNVGYRLGELDLVMVEGKTLVFVEVRYRNGKRFGGAAASVTRAKQRRIAHAAGAFLAAQPAWAKQACRFDVVALSGSADRPEVEWIRNAFTLDDL